MDSIISVIQKGVGKAFKSLYQQELDETQVLVQVTRKEFEGDYTIVVFPLTRLTGKKPDELAQELGNFLVNELEEISAFNVIKGFLNLTVANVYWGAFLQEVGKLAHYGQFPPNGHKVMVEFCSPNTNKPLHLGHIRNILLGWSCARILEAAGYEVVRVQVINDRGIAVCKSMVAWQDYGNGATPESTGIKSDHFVGEYYVEFEKRLQPEYKTWQASEAGQQVYREKAKEGQSPEAFFKAFKNQYVNEYSELGKKASDMLLRWEAGDPETVALWKKMNGWVYEGFEQTFKDLGVRFDKLYYESETYLLGKDLVEKGLNEGVFYRQDDGSVWADLSGIGMDPKIVIRSNGTSVYTTQDIGTAHLRYQDFGVDKMVYVVADEQNHHFQALFEILKRLGEPYAEGLHHLAYGMVELPEGKMKSREGTVVDADDLIAEVIEEARLNASERGEVAELSAAEQEMIIRRVGLAALKFHIIKVQPKKWMTFDPKESVDMQGQTGPYIQYAYVRINGLINRARREGIDFATGSAYLDFQPAERELLQQLYQFPDTIQEAAMGYDPSTVANYCYSLAKAYSKLWHDLPVFNAEDPAAKAFRLQLSRVTGDVLRFGMDLLGIQMPEKM
ncbi:MAG: arginine--tRNA ligase [Saprospirales bacterium]|nr:arginine--tRNA ligase [Saprospirales bacterium]MBK8491928.1 arginine--tRNA ligase [Saprospirales bacterium]